MAPGLVVGYGLSRSFLGFLLFCLALAAVSAGVVWYVGPTLAGIVFDEGRRANPYYLVQLLPPMSAAEVGAPSYRSEFLALAAEENGRLLWEGYQPEVLEGPVRLKVATAQVLEFATGGDLVQMLTSSGYRSLNGRAGPLDLRLIGVAEAPLALAGGGATVLVLYRTDAGARLPLGVPGEGGWLGLVEPFGGEVRWRAPVELIRGDSPWNRVLLLQFPDAVSAEGWLNDPVTRTERALAGKHVSGLTVLLTQGTGLALGWRPG